MLSGSPAIDAGNNALAVDADDNPLLTDQRGVGFERIQDGGSGTATVDIGAFEVKFADSFLLGDVNQDGEVDFDDISPFITILASGTFLDQADTNQDGMVDFDDISPFITLLANGGTAESNATAQSNQVAESLVAPDIASETSVESDSAAVTPPVSSPVSQRTISEPMSMSVASPVEVPVARSTSTVKPAADTSNSIQSQDVTGTITSPPAPVDSADNSMASPMVEQSELPVTGPISASATPVDSYIGPVAFASAKHSFSVDRNSSLNRFKTNGLLALQGSLKGSTERLASSHEQHPVTNVSTNDSFSTAAALFDAHPESLDEIFDFELDDSLAGLI